jgi:hypothetical protein
LFVGKRAVSEDLREAKTQSGKRTLSFISAIYSVTEFVLFLKRVYESLGSVDHVRITVRLTGCKERVLASFDAAVSLLGGYQSWEDQIVFQQDFQVVELRAEAQDIALRIVKHIFHVFNWTDVTDETIAHWQNELLKRLR